MHAIHMPKSKGKALHRNRKVLQRAVSKKTKRIKGKAMLQLAQHDKGAERKIGFLSSQAESRELFNGLKRKGQ